MKNLRPFFIISNLFFAIVGFVVGLVFFKFYQADLVDEFKDLRFSDYGFSGSTEEMKHLEIIREVMVLYSQALENLSVIIVFVGVLSLFNAFYIFQSRGKSNVP